MTLYREDHPARGDVLGVVIAAVATAGLLVWLAVRAVLASP